jgi:hypothetical protein
MASFGFAIRRFYIAYAYDQNISEMAKFYAGSHEIMFGVNIGLYEPQGLRKKARVKN